MNLLLPIIAAFLITFILLPIIIKVSKSIDLLDAPDRRKIHSISTPSLGGIGIYTGFMLAAIMAIPLIDLAELKFFLFGLTMIFLLGVRDDISSLAAKHKLFTQIFASLMVVYFADIHLTGLYGMLGVSELPHWFNLIFSTFVVVALTNSYNLIDGIDGLAGSVGILILSFFGWVFISAGEIAYGIVCFSVAGSLLAFLFFNWSPSKVFMGDTGSMVLGFIISTLAIKFINTAPGVTISEYFTIGGSVGVCIAAIILPMVDTCRVFVIRFINGKNPLDPDRNHLHHGLLKLGLSHSQATICLLGFNVLILSFGLFLDRFLFNGELILSIFGLSMVFIGILDYKLHRKRYLGKGTKVVEKELYISKSA